MMEEKMETRAAREIVAMMGDKALFSYIPGMEIKTMESDSRSSLDKIACYFHEEQFAISDLYIGYAVSLYRYTIPKVIAATIKVFGDLWPQKHIPKSIDRDALRNRMRKMCGMGMLRRVAYDLNGKQIVLYSATPEFAKVIYQSLKIATDSRPEKDMIPPIEILGHAASSLITSELMSSPYLKEFNFMPKYWFHDTLYIFNGKFTHEINGETFITIVEPLFTRVDTKRFTKEEWNAYLQARVEALWGYVDLQEKKQEGRLQLIIVCEDKDDFKNAGTLICNVFPESYLDRIYFTSEGAMKSGENILKNNLIRITSLAQNESEPSVKRPESVSSLPLYQFF